jgi:nucleosome binding factor SPN SPT16 subunit
MCLLLSLLMLTPLATNVQGESIEVLYANIRLAVYQPCEGKDTKVVLHFHLKHPIMVGKKAHKDIQVTLHTTAYSTFLSNFVLYDLSL